MAKQVKAVVSHNQEIDGKKYKAGDSVSLDKDLARVLLQRDAIQVNENEVAVRPVAADKKEASK